jgi:hypothetical protein
MGMFCSLTRSSDTFALSRNLSRQHANSLFHKSICKLTLVNSPNNPRNFFNNLAASDLLHALIAIAVFTVSSKLPRCKPHDQCQAGSAFPQSLLE